MDGDCYCLKQNNDNTCTSFQPPCPRNTALPCDKFELSSLCELSPFFVLPYVFPSENKKFHFMKIMADNHGFNVTNLGI